MRSNEFPTAILLVSCPDRPGIVAAISAFLFENRGNIVDIDQHVDSGAGVFFMLGLTAAVSMVFGALGKHSARFPLNYINEAANVVWKHTRRKIGTRYPPPVQTADDVKFTTTYTTIRGHIFKIPIAERGGEGGATTSIGNTLVLMTHDGRFFAGTAEAGSPRCLRRSSYPATLDPSPRRNASST